jgi:hypothetical protein
VKSSITLRRVLRISLYFMGEVEFVSSPIFLRRLFIELRSYTVTDGTKRL